MPLYPSLILAIRFPQMLGLLIMNDADVREGDGFWASHEKGICRSLI